MNLEFGRGEDAKFRLIFGTAGLRAEMGPGPDRINAETIQLAAQGLTEYYLESEESKSGNDLQSAVVVGYDARHLSKELADVVRRVLGSKGIATAGFSQPVPTPLVAYAVAKFDCAGGIVITG